MAERGPGLPKAPVTRFDHGATVGGELPVSLVWCSCGERALLAPSASSKALVKVVGLLRIELRTSALSVLRSNRLSYSPLPPADQPAPQAYRPAVARPTSMRPAGHPQGTAPSTAGRSSLLLRGQGDPDPANHVTDQVIKQSGHDVDQDAEEAERGTHGRAPGQRG